MSGKRWAKLAFLVRTKTRAPFSRAFAAFCFVLAYVTFAHAAGTLPPPGEYVVDGTASSLAFNVTHFVVSSVDGRFKTFAGHVIVGDTLASTRIEATADTSSIDTGNQTRDGHLRSADNFDVARFPTMTFKSTLLWGTPTSFGIKGNLTIKGVTKEVVFSARIQDSGLILAEAKVDRTDFGIDTGGPVKNEVRLRLRINLVKSGGAAP
jgi:polyisoprenoid-binding protein YceI